MGAKIWVCFRFQINIGADGTSFQFWAVELNVKVIN